MNRETRSQDDEFLVNGFYFSTGKPFLLGCPFAYSATLDAHINVYINWSIILKTINIPESQNCIPFLDLSMRNTFL